VDEIAYTTSPAVRGHHRPARSGQRPRLWSLSDTTLMNGTTAVWTLLN
jgi:hypothetical protein